MQNKRALDWKLTFWTNVSRYSLYIFSRSHKKLEFLYVGRWLCLIVLVEMHESLDCFVIFLFQILHVNAWQLASLYLYVTVHFSSYSCFFCSMLCFCCAGRPILRVSVFSCFPIKIQMWPYKSAVLTKLRNTFLLIWDVHHWRQTEAKESTDGKHIKPLQTEVTQDLTSGSW